MHGLNRAYLHRNGFETEDQLVADFHAWRHRFCINEIYGHQPEKESTLLNIPITDIRLPIWALRVELPSHRKAMEMKASASPIHHTFCLPYVVHNEYRGWTRVRSEGDRARHAFGVHCALIDCAEMVLHLYPEADLATSPQERCSMTTCR